MRVNRIELILVDSQLIVIQTQPIYNKSETTLNAFDSAINV